MCATILVNSFRLIVRGYKNWMDDCKPSREIRICLDVMIEERWKTDQDVAENKTPDSSEAVKRP